MQTRAVRTVLSSLETSGLSRMKKRRAPKQQSEAPSSESKKIKKQSFFLMKSEVDVFSIDDLANASVPEPWDGVRNHQAKKIMMSMSEGDLAFFWASNTKEPGIVGLVKVVKEAYPDETQFQTDSKYYDKKASRNHPIWYNVDVVLEKKFAKPILLKDLKQYADAELKDMPLFLMKRLSVQTVPLHAWEFIMSIEES